MFVIRQVSVDQQKKGEDSAVQSDGQQKDIAEAKRRINKFENNPLDATSFEQKDAREAREALRQGRGPKREGPDSPSNPLPQAMMDAISDFISRLNMDLSKFALPIARRIRLLNPGMLPVTGAAVMGTRRFATVKKLLGRLLTGVERVGEKVAEIRESNRGSVVPSGSQERDEALRDHLEGETRRLVPEQQEEPPAGSGAKIIKLNPLVRD